MSRNRFELLLSNFHFADNIFIVCDNGLEKLQRKFQKIFMKIENILSLMKHWFHIEDSSLNDTYQIKHTNRIISIMVKRYIWKIYSQLVVLEKQN